MDKLLNNMSAKTRKMVFWGGIMLLALVSYQCSVKKALEAWRINRELTRQSADVKETSSVSQEMRRQAYYAAIVKKYKVRAVNWDNTLWQALSGIALAKQVNISFTPEPQNVADTAHVGLLSKKFSFKGDYHKIVSLLDSLHKTNNIGKVSALTLGVPKEDEGKGLELKVVIKGLSSSSNID